MIRESKYFGRALGSGLALALLALVVWRQQSLPSEPKQVAPGVESTTKESSMEKNTEQLGPRAEITRELESGGSHSYELTLEADQFLQVVVDQQGIDVAAELYGPDNSLVIKVDSPIGRQGPETVVALADAPGVYVLKVRAVETGAPAGKYHLSVPEMRTATQHDRDRAAAEKIFSEAEELRREGTAESLRLAAESYREALTAWRRLADVEREADGLQRLGWVYSSLDDHEATRVSLESALEKYRTLKQGRGEAIVLNSLALLQLRLGEVDEAQNNAQQALEIYRDLGLRNMAWDALNNLGIVLRRLGKIEDALAAHATALELSEELGDLPKRARSLGNLGVLLLHQGKLEEAADQLQSALDIWATGNWATEADLRWVAFTSSRLGDVRKRQGRLEDAIRHLQKALELRRQSGSHRGAAVTLNSLGTTHLLREEYEPGRVCYEEAIEILRELGDELTAATILVNLGRLHVKAGNPERALELHQEAAPLLSKFGDPQIEASNMYGVAKALYDLEDFTAALHSLESTLERVEQLREETDREGLRIAFFATKQHYFDLYIEVLMRLHETTLKESYVTVAFEAAERRRARALLDVLGESAADIRRGLDPSLLERERLEQQKLNDLERHRTELLRKDQRREEEITAAEKNARQSRLELDEIRGKIRTARESALQHSQPISLKEIRNLLLDQNTLLLSYALGEHRSFLWLVSRDAVSSHVLPGREQIQEAAVEAHSLLTQRRSTAKNIRERHLAQLSKLLLGPIADQLGTRRLLIVAEGALLYLPFSALPDPANNETSLVERHEIVYLPSASVLLALRQEAAGRYPAPKLLAIFADPVFNSNGGDRSEAIAEERGFFRDTALMRSAADFALETFEPLPHTRDEAKAILALARGEVMEALGFDANKKRVLHGGLHEYQILHFATHGLLNRDHPELSGLVFSLFDEEGRPQDGFVRLHEIYNLHLPSELVVLSACRTGLGQEVRGEGLLGLTRGFMYAGTPRVVVSLWNVSDRGTAELMKRFYWGILEAGANPALALRAAQISMCEEDDWRHPYYWAGFVLQGEWRSPGKTDDDAPIEGAYGGGGADDDPDVDYPGPDELWCEGLTEPWERRICRILQKLRS